MPWMCSSLKIWRTGTVGRLNGRPWILNQKALKYSIPLSNNRYAGCSGTSVKGWRLVLIIWFVGTFIAQDRRPSPVVYCISESEGHKTFIAIRVHSSIVQPGLMASNSMHPISHEYSPGPTTIVSQSTLSDPTIPPLTASCDIILF